MAANEFGPDWVKVWTKETAEEQLGGTNPFVFKSAGWYYEKNGDTILVLPTNDSLRFQFNVYNGRDPGPHFNYIVNAPVQTDER